MTRLEIVWLEEERRFAELINLGAHYSTVRYTQKGITYEIIVANDEFEYTDDRGSEDDDDE